MIFQFELFLDIEIEMSYTNQISNNVYENDYFEIQYYLYLTSFIISRSVIENEINQISINSPYINLREFSNQIERISKLVKISPSTLTKKDNDIIKYLCEILNV